MNESPAAASTIRETTRRDDPAVEPWLRLYREAFPVHERMSEDYLLRVLKGKERGEEAAAHMLWMSLPNSSQLCGLAYFEVHSGAGLGFLWYLAIREDLRNCGLGRVLYSEVLRRTREERADLLVFEVDIPESELAGTGTEAYAARRIEWYRRQGAHVLQGVEYWQEVDTGVPPTQMHLMAHCLAPLTAEEVYARAVGFFGENIRQTGALQLY